jgi:hypothetical protein
VEERAGRVGGIMGRSEGRSRVGWRREKGGWRNKWDRVEEGVGRIVLQNVKLPNAELQNAKNTKRRIAKRRLQNVESYKRYSGRK